MRYLVFVIAFLLAGSAFATDEASKPLPPSAQAILNKAEKAIASNRAKYDDANKKPLADADKALKAEQDKLGKAGKLEEALAIKEVLKSFKDELVAKVDKRVVEEDESGTTMQLVLWNLQEPDRATDEVAIELYQGKKMVYKKEKIKVEHEGGVVKQTVVTLPAKSIDRVRIHVTKFIQNGGGFTEVQLFKGEDLTNNYALNCKTTASEQPSYPACTPDKAVDGTTEHRLENIWTLANFKTGYLDIFLKDSVPEKN